MKIPNVPFIPNTHDDTHCLQAAYMSIAKYFDPTFSMNMTRWSSVTGYEEGLGTWANAGLVWFKQQGYDVVHYERFDFDAFIENPREYMIQLHGREAGEWGIEHTNVPAEIERMKTLQSLNITKMRRPALSDIRRFLADGYLVRVTLNASRLESEPGYVGHAVVVFNVNESHVTFHDPGLPPIPNRTVPIKLFEAAWFDQEPELDAIKRLVS